MTKNVSKDCAQKYATETDGALIVLYNGDRERMVRTYSIYLVLHCFVSIFYRLETDRVIY